MLRTCNTSTHKNTHKRGYTDMATQLGTALADCSQVISADRRFGRRLSLINKSRIVCQMRQMRTRSSQLQQQLATGNLQLATATTAMRKAIAATQLASIWPQRWRRWRHALHAKQPRTGQHRKGQAAEAETVRGRGAGTGKAA